MTCPKCAAQIPDDAKSCIMCGTVINSPIVAATPVVPGAPAQPVSTVVIDSGKHAASQWLRLVNYFIDAIGLSIFSFIVNLLFFWGFFNELETADKLDGQVPQMIAFVLFSFLATAIYYVFFEAIWQRTPGKWASGTKVVNLDGSKPGIGRIIGRSFARYIPFEPFSYLFGRYPYGWHDALTKTTVVSASYTPADIQSINIHEKGKSSGWMIVLAVAAILLPMIAIVGILASVVLASLNTARTLGSDSAAKSSLSAMRAQGELYFDRNNSYEGVCMSEEAAPMRATMDSKRLISSCNDSEAAWAAAVQLSDKSIWCADSAGYNELRLGDLDSAVSCSRELVGGEVKWFTYTAPVDGFSVSLPREPVVSREDDVSLGIGNETMDQSFYEAQDDANYYSVGKIVYSISLAESDPKEILESLRDAVVGSSPANKLVSSRHFTYMGDPALEFVAKIEGVLFSGRYMVADDNTIYSLLFGYEESAYDEATYKKFVDSFKK